MEATSYAGGLTAAADHLNVKIQNCFNVGTVYGTSVAAGIVASATNVAMTIENTYNVGTVNCFRPAYIYPIYFSSGVIGSATLSNLYYLPSTSYQTAKERITQASASQLAGGNLTGINTLGIWTVLTLSDTNKYPFSQLVENPYYGEYDLTGLIEDNVNFKGGYGSTDSPYLISNINHLKNIKLKPNAVFSQTQNIEDELTEPIGEFGGTYKGNGYSVNLNIDNSTGTQLGLFSKLNGAKIDSVVTKGRVKGIDYLGGIAGEASLVTLITNCINEAAIESTNGRCGGIIGSFYGATSGSKIEGCVNKGTVISKNINVGGITGLLAEKAVVNLCKNIGAISGYDVGGIVGYSYGNVTKSYNLGTVTLYGDGSSCGAGIVGKTRSISGAVSDCYNAGKILGVNVAGIIGYSYPSPAGIKIVNCYNIGIAANPITGGDSTSSVSNCYYLSYDLESDGLDSSATSTTDPTVAVSSLNLSKLNIGSSFVANTGSEIYSYPQIIGNLQTEPLQLVLLSVSILEGSGETTLTGNHYVKTNEPIEIAITPAANYYIGEVKRGAASVVIGHSGEKKYTVPVGIENESVTISFKELLLNDAISISSPVSYTPTSVEPYQIDDATTVTTYGISFATAKNIYANYTLIEYGMLFSKNMEELTGEQIIVDGIKVKKAIAAFNGLGLGQYGILFCGNGIVPGTNYYTKSYAIYQSNENPESVLMVYGDQINSFTPLF